MIKSVIQASSDKARVGNMQYALAPDVVLLCLEDGTGRLLAMNSRFYGLSQVATTMLAAVLAEGIEVTVQYIVGAYHVETERVWHDLLGLLSELEQRRLIYRPGQPSSLKKPGEHLATAILLLGLRCIYSCQLSFRTRVSALLVLAYVSIRLSGWQTTVMGWHDIALKHMNNGAFGVPVQMISEMVELVASKHLLPITCKERALVCWSLSSMAGIAARLVVGIDLFPLTSHCWCQSGQMILCDEEEKCQSFTPILSYG